MLYFTMERPINYKLATRITEFLCNEDNTYELNWALNQLSTNTLFELQSHLNCVIQTRVLCKTECIVEELKRKKTNI